MTDRFAFDYAPLYAALEEAQEAVRGELALMEEECSSSSIETYEAALDRMAAARKAIGVANDADMRRRSVAAGLIAA